MSFFKKLKEKFVGTKGPDETSQITETSEQLEQKEEQISIGEKFKQGLAKTRDSFSSRVNELVARYRKVDEDFFEELEEILIQADVGFDTVMQLIDELKMEVKRRNISDTSEVQTVISEKLGIFTRVVMKIHLS